MIKTNFGLVEHCKKALEEGWYYGWGSYGQIATRTLVNKLVFQYPDMNTRWHSYMLKAVNKNTRLSDCYGLVKSYLWWTDDSNNPKYNSLQDKNTDGAISLSEEKGLLCSMPEIQGLILWHKGHVGIYIGDGEFIECVGAGRGMQKGLISNGKIVKGSKFTHWFKDINISYLDNNLSTNIINETNVDDENTENTNVNEHVVILDVTPFMIDEKEYVIERIMIEDKNYVNFRDVAKIFDYDVGYDEEKKLPVLTER